MGNQVRAVVAGATGYSGYELIRMLLAHPRMELVGAFASPTSTSTPIAEVHPQLTGLTSLVCQPFDDSVIAGLKPDLIFLATPNEFSNDVVPTLLETGATIVDLSGSFRLKKAALYPKYYGFEPKQAALLEKAVYAITEFSREELRGAKLIANPGCYPTSILVPLTPLMRAGLIDQSQTIICDSKSGVTGAGKTPTPGTHFVEVSESFKVYNAFKHRHAPEIAQGLGFELSPQKLIFTPHLLPINRGILSTIYVRLKSGVKRADIINTWQQAFETSPFVRIFAGAQLPEIKFTAHTPYCDIGCVVSESDESGTGSQAIIVSSIDNLLKGAASQAMQNANLALGFEEHLGIRA